MTATAADSTRPWLIPGSIRYAIAYANGIYAWPDDQTDRFAGHVKIGVLSGEPGQAATCRELDVERFDAGPADAPPFIAARRALGHDDATLYVNRANLPAVADRLVVADVPDLESIRWHVATLDGTKRPAVPFGILWAVQFEIVAQAYDV